MKKGQTKAAVMARALKEHGGDRITTKKDEDGAGGWTATVWKGKRIKSGAWARGGEFAAICALIEVP